MKLTVREAVTFSMYGAMMFATKVLMEFLPNIHLLGCLTMVFTIVYRQKALYPIYIYVFINGIFAGFAPWWIPYLYLWTVLWGVTMLIPKNLTPKRMMAVCMVVCAMHGFLFGTLYAPAQALIYGLNFKGMITWIIVGLPYDAIHGVSNFFCGTLIVPLVMALRKIESTFAKR